MNTRSKIKQNSAGSNWGEVTLSCISKEGNLSNMGLGKLAGHMYRRIEPDPCLSACTKKQNKTKTCKWVKGLILVPETLREKIGETF